MTETKKGATYDDVRDAPNDRIAELFDGDLILSPRPAIRHAKVISVLGAHLVSGFQIGHRGEEDGWWILDEPEVHLESNVFVPDVAGWRHSTLGSLPDAPAIEIAPDWVCEVLSPATADLDRMRKLPLYHRYGVSWIWLIDPGNRTLEALVRRERGWEKSGFWSGGVVARAAPFESIDLDLATLWLD
ncbi:MAG TPA: Uma2 family endonuclease [Thermoanaerobaculia bacterium]|nr:Uma2 family endonuclease [Thermoanaerobaculia bacterium]